MNSVVPTLFSSYSTSSNKIATIQFYGYTKNDYVTFPKIVDSSHISTRETITPSQMLAVRTVPFYSQFDDISAIEWKKIGCGITSLAMLIEYYEPGEITVDALLTEGISSGAYLNNAGWIHRGLALLADKHGLKGKNFDFSSSSMDSAFDTFKKSLKEGPAIASVYYTFDPQSPIPHLVVINDIEGDTVYYNDPSEVSGGGTISTDKFKKAWKKRWIEIRSRV